MDWLEKRGIFQEFDKAVSQIKEKSDERFFSPLLIFLATIKIGQESAGNRMQSVDRRWINSNSSATTRRVFSRFFCTAVQLNMKNKWISIEWVGQRYG
jgi:hypothetical protein